MRSSNVTICPCLSAVPTLATVRKHGQLPDWQAAMATSQPSFFRLMRALPFLNLHPPPVGPALLQVCPPHLASDQR